MWELSPTKRGGGTTGDSLFMCPYSCRGYFPPFPGACAGGPRFLETFANREATCRSVHQGVVLPAKHLPCGADMVESRGLAQNLACLELEQWKAQEHQSRGGNERES